ncbi:MAG: LPS-assembly protein LptD [Xanthobacteraceae bacterium]
MPARCSGRAAGLALAAVLLGASLTPGLAQQPASPGASDQAKDAKSKQTTGADLLTARVKSNPDAKMLVRANEILYDYQREQVSAVGQVQIYYDGAVLEADKVTHDRKTNRLNAQGNVRYQAKDGNVIRTDAIDLDADFRDGFIQSLHVETPDRTRFAAARGQRSGGNITVLESGVYTACEPCKEDPTRPPLWQVKAARIVHNEKERVVHYENATLEFFGMPVAWFPYFWHPDPTVKRQTGFLQPTFFSSSRIGTGVIIPYYWAPAPNYDVTFSVAPMTRQLGPLVSAEWRHRVMKGSYEIRVAGIFQQDKEAFLDNGPTPGYRDFRGAVETKGRFRINDKWHWGWDATLLTDRFFLSDYTIATEGGASERSSQVFLTGQGERSYFDLRAMGFIGFSRLDHREQLPYIHPVMDYSYVFDKPVLGGELGVRMNFVSLTRQEADFAPTSQLALINASVDPGDPIASPHCDITKIGFNPGATNCFLRGFSGDYTRFTAESNWRRTLTNGWGMVFKPFMTARTDFATRGVDSTLGIGSYAEAGRENLVRAMPTAGMEVRWPFISVHSWGTQVLEPIGQIIVRPNETHIGKFPNEDAQSLVFDDTTLFAIDKYSGYDRVEGGTRANIGVQYTANIHRYGMVNVLFGQSYHLAGKNSFAETGQFDGTGMEVGYGGLQSGLETDTSDYVSRIYYQPVGNVSLAARFRFDRQTFDVRRMEIETRSTWDRLSLATIYARYEEQPLIGYLNRREGIYQTAAFRLHDNWSIFGGVRYDLDRDKFDLSMIGLSYVDECFAATLSYVADETNLTYTKPVHRIMLRMNLRTLGGTGFSTQLGSDRTGP